MVSTTGTALPDVTPAGTCKLTCRTPAASP